MALLVHAEHCTNESCFLFTAKMPHSFGYRAATRTLFKKPYKTAGAPHTKVFLRNFKVSLLASITLAWANWLLFYPGSLRLSSTYLE